MDIYTSHINVKSQQTYLLLAKPYYNNNIYKYQTINKSLFHN